VRMKPLPILTIAIVVTLLMAGITVVAFNDSAEASVLMKFNSDSDLRSFLEKNSAQDGTARDNIGYATAEVAASYSGTNNQMQGVDEGDQIKTDGRTIFIAEGNVVHLIGTDPSLHNLTDLSVGITNDNNYTSIVGLYLWNGHLIVVYTVYEYHPVQGSSLEDNISLMYCPYWSTQKTVVLVYDVNDPLHPLLRFSGGITGTVLTARMINDTVYIVAEQNIWNGGDIYVPEVSTNGENIAIEATAISYDPTCSDISYFMNLLALNVSSGQMNSITALVGLASVVYMSETSMYLTMQHWSDLGNTLFSDGRSQATTQIYRIAVRGTDMAPAAQGGVEGILLNQFAIDEQKGRLRVATTATSSEPTSSVHVLDLELREVGSLDNIAPGERIYSSRYMDDRLYLVTLRQVDPLFVIDLTTDAPSILGQLKVPGASTYLQMVDEGLLGIGFENGSVKVSLYNVTDPEQLHEIGCYVVEGYSYSAAQYDHHAVLYDPNHGLLVIPITSYSSWAYDHVRSAALVLSIDSDGIAPVGGLLHDNATVGRSLYIGDVLYTISDTTVKAYSLPTLSSLDELVYSEGQRYYYGWSGGAELLMVD
jgi:inhibitor of cysteine peptidase